MTAVSEPTTALAHPLEPLTPDEVGAASALLRDLRDLPATARFVFVTLHEPARADVLRWEPGHDPLPREAHIVLYERSARATYEAVVSLSDRVLVSWTAVEAVQPSIMGEEFETCEAIVVADPRWQEAMRRRGVEDLSLAMVDPWASSWPGPQDDPSARRIARPLTWLRSAPGENGYARPVEGLIVVVDLDKGEVVDVTDHGVVPFPTASGNYEEPWIFEAGNVPAFDGPRTDVAPIEITQPDGPSFTVDGHSVAWQKWTLRIGFTPREGLVLHQVAYAGRPIVHRASLAEMYVRYGDPAPTHRFKNVFDQGEYGVGWLANSLTLGCDCVGDIRYFDGVVNDYEVKLTGVISTAAIAPGETPGHGTLVAPGLYGPHHQHTVPPMYAPDALFARRAGFTDHQLWVAAYDDTQRFAAGDYPNQHPGGQGLPAYVTGDRPLEGADVVVWYTFGAHHVVRPEDWPVMPVSTVGFMLKPSGFFDGNPALDLPPTSPHCHPA